MEFNIQNEILQSLDDGIKQLVHLKLNTPGDTMFDKIQTDSFGELIDKLVIVHIRYWHLEDAMSDKTLSDNELATLRRKSESLFKSKRPMLVNALDKYLVNLISGGEVLIPENLKLYKGWNS